MHAIKFNSVTLVVSLLLFDTRVTAFPLFFFFYAHTPEQFRIVLTKKKEQKKKTSFLPSQLTLQSF